MPPNATATPANPRPRLRDLVSGKPLPSLRMTEAQFVAWSDEDTRAEWVDGEVVLMAPDNDEHVDLNDWLTAIVRPFVEERRLGVIRSKTSMIRLATQRRRRLPDLHFIAGARAHIIKPTYVEGAPDLVIEIVSPDSGSRDRREKFFEYEKAGVKEYWIIDPLAKRVELYVLKGRKYEQRSEETGGVLRSVVLSGFFLKPKWLWQRPLPNVLKTLRELGVRG
jgi:Uma2 family endonuclease